MVARFRKVATLAAWSVLAACAGHPVEGERARTDPNRLFVIERSLNANVVVYDAVRSRDGRLDRSDPVTAYWLMNAEHGQRQSLNLIERLKAYGFKVESDHGGNVELRVAALESRPIQIRTERGRAQAIVRIAGAPAVLHRVFVRTRPGHPLDVESVELFGELVSNHRAVHESLKPG